MWCHRERERLCARRCRSGTVTRRSAMAQWCHSRAIGLVCFAVLLLHFQSLVVAQGDPSKCPSLPSSSEDPAWKNGFSDAQTTALQVTVMRKLRILIGSFTQGPKPLVPIPAASDTPPSGMLLGVKLAVSKAAPSIYRDAYSVSIRLTLGLWHKYSVVPIGSRGTRGKPQIHAGSDNELVIVGEGIFSVATGELCMVGCIGAECNYKLNLKYPTPKNIRQVSIVGNLSSILAATDANYFDSVAITSISEAPFEYTKNETLKKLCPTFAADASPGKFWKEEKVCRQGWSKQPSEITLDLACQGANCSPFAGVAKTDKGLMLTFDRVHCDGNRVHAFVALPDGMPDRFADPTTSGRMLVAEGVWDMSTGQLCMLACRLAGTEDCQIAITMQFPLTLTVTQRALVVGHVRSLRDETDASYFRPLTFWQSITGLMIPRSTNALSQQEYVYSKVEKAKKTCFAGSPRPRSDSKYPSGADWQDLDIRAHKDGRIPDPSLSPFVKLNVLTVGSQFRRFGLVHAGGAGNLTAPGEQKMMNVSYSLFFQTRKNDFWRAEIPAEGVYDPATGRLCLIACQVVDLSIKGLTELEGERQQDCQLFFSIQLPAINSGKESLKGSLRSLRNATDPLYFKPESFSGFVRLQAVESVWRQDLEIVMSVVMLSLTVVFIILQLVYSKRYPDTLPYISTSMLLLLTLAHMIPLVLNFEALFQKQNSYNSLRMPDGWPEANEVVVRLTTMTAMLLQLRLLQLVWKSRIDARATGDLSPAVQERRVLGTVLPLYFVGGLIAVLVHALFGFKPIEREFLWRSNQGGLWWDIKAYGGLLLDFHLFPQVIGNILWGAKEQAPLSKPFYLGMALVRSLPHIYDICRQFRFIPSFSDMYVYANPEWDFYSVTSDVLIPSGVLLLAILVYMQQRWGGRCVLPRRWRSSFEYEKVPSIGT